MNLVFCTISVDKAEEFTNILLEKKLIACVNMIEQVKSKYWWEGKIQVDQETLLIMKTKKELAQELKEAIEIYHPYDVPEIVFIDVDKVNQPYLDWILSNTTNILEQI